MSYEDVINIINAHYGWSMDAHEPEYKGEIKEKMQAMKQFVKELSAKAEAFDRIVKESQGAFSCGEFCDDVRHIINSYEIGVTSDEL